MHRGWSDVLLVVSNLFFAVPVLFSLRRGLYIEMSIIAISGSVSILFHMCQSNFMCLDSSGLYLDVMDHTFAATYAVVLATALIANIKPKRSHAFEYTLSQARGIILVVALVFNAIAFCMSDYNITSAHSGALVVYACVVVIAAIVASSYHKRKRYSVHKGRMITSVIILGTGYGLFFISDNYETYGISHSLWHVCCALASSLFFSSLANLDPVTVPLSH